MRFGLVAIAASLVAHVAIMELIGAVDPPEARPRPRPTRITIVDAPTLTIEPIGIELVAAPVVTPSGPEPVAATAPPQRVATQPRAVARPGVATGAPAVATGVEGTVAVAIEPTAPSDGRPGQPGLFTMRRAPAPNFDPRHVTEGLEVSGGAPPPPPLIASGELEPSGGGTFRSEQPGFRADVKRDGTVTFKDRPAFSFKLHTPNPRAIARGAARGVERWFDDPDAAIRAADRDPGREPPRMAGGPSTTAQDDLPPPLVAITLLSGSSEITDWVMRKGGIDPYASAKRRFLDQTRDERAALRIERDEELRKRSVATIRKHVARVWKRPDLDAPTRRAAIFELWDECVEDGDEQVVDAGNRARAAVIGFVRGHLPAGSPDAFTTDELAALNRTRTSKAPFAPYP